MKRLSGWMLLGGAATALACVLGLYEWTSAAPPPTQGPWANSLEQRIEMLDQLKQTNALLQEQNALLKEQLGLLRSGQVKVIVTLPPEIGK